MKTKGFIVFLTLLFLLVSGCSSDEGTRTFVQEEEGIYTEVAYDYNGDKVTRVKTITEMDYELLGYGDKNEAEEDLADFMNMYEDVAGLNQEMTFDETTLTETLTVDYDKVNLKEIKKIPGLEGVEDGAKGISMKATAKNMTEKGYTEK